MLWTHAAQRRYTAALAAFDAKRPIRDVFSGVALASRDGGALSNAQIQLIWRQMGWTANSWSAQYLRAHAAQLYDEWGLAHLHELGPSIGHRAPTTTRDNYTGHTPWGKAQVAQRIATELGW